MARRGPWTTTWRGTALLAGLLALAAALLLWRAPWQEAAPVPVAGDRQTAELAHLKALGDALRLHADEHEGRYPDTIGNIEWRQGKPGMEAGGLPAVASRFHTDNGRVMDWLYYPGHTAADAPETILVASPVAVGPGQDHRMILRLSNVAEIVPEQDFQRQVGQTP